MKILKKYFTVWWIPIIFYIFPILGFIIGVSRKSNDIIDYALDIFLINLTGTAISLIVQVVIAFRKKWYYVFYIIPQILISGIFFFMVSFYFGIMRVDYYGANKEIPKNAGCESPLKNALNEKAIEENGLKANDIKLQGGYGHYSYYVNFQPKEKGYLYIKAYEITSNDSISQDYLNDESAQIKIENLDQKFHSGSFTIYKGNMGYKYCTRMELWYKPNNKKEYKITQKNYIIEGDSG